MEHNVTYFIKIHTNKQKTHTITNNKIHRIYFFFILFFAIVLILCHFSFLLIPLPPPFISICCSLLSFCCCCACDCFFLSYSSRIRLNVCGSLTLNTSIASSLHSLRLSFQCCLLSKNASTILGHIVFLSPM